MIIEAIAGIFSNVVSGIILEKIYPNRCKYSKHKRYRLYLDGNFIRETNSSRLLQNILLNSDDFYIKNFLNVKKIEGSYLIIDKKKYNNLNRSEVRNYVKLNREEDLYVLKIRDYSRSKEIAKNLAKECNVKIKLKSCK